MKPNLTFEPTRSYVYKASRYEILPRIEKKAESYGEKPFLLRELSREVLEELHTDEQLETKVKKARSDKMEKIRTIFNFFIPSLAENLKVFNKEGDGYFRNISIEDEIAEVEDEIIEEDGDDAGFIYAYTFPSLERRDTAFPIKIGMTMANPEDRVNNQCKQTCCFEFPKVLKTWEVQRVKHVESAIHSTLKARGLKLNAPGTEWFESTLPEVSKIIEFIKS